MKLKISKKKMMLVERLIKEELNRQIGRADFIEIVDDDPIVLCEQAKKRLAMNEGVLTSIAAKAKGAAAKVAAAGGNIGTAAQMAVAAAKGDKEAVTGLAASLQNVDMAGQVKQAESLVQGFTKKQVAMFKEFAEDLTRAGLTGLPGVADVVARVADKAEEMLTHTSDQIMDQLKNGIKEIQKVAKKTGADKAAKDGKKAGAGKEAPTAGKSGAEAGEEDSDAGYMGDQEKAKQGEEGESVLKTMAKGIGSLVKETNKTTKRRKR